MATVCVFFVTKGIHDIFEVDHIEEVVFKFWDIHSLGNVKVLKFYCLSAVLQSFTLFVFGHDLCILKACVDVLTFE